MKKDEALAYAQQLLRESGATDEEVTQAAKLFEREKFFNGFIPRPEVDRSLGAERDARKAAEEKANYYEKDWFPKANAAYEENKRGLATLKEYEQKFGPLNGNGTGGGNGGGGGSMDAETIRKMIREENQRGFDAFGATTMEYLDIADDYREKFGKRIPRKEFETFCAEQQKNGAFRGLDRAYSEFIAPQVEASNKAAQEARDKRIREEAIADYTAKHGLPDDSRPTERSIMFRRDDDGDKDDKMDAREAFIHALDHPEDAAKRL